MPSFAEEVAASRSKASVPPPAAPEAAPAAAPAAPAPVEAAPAAPVSPVEGMGPMPNHGDVYVEPVLPVGAAPNVPPVEAAPAAAPAAPVAAAPVTPPAVVAPNPEVKKPIKIGTREFTDYQDALAYAQELELSNVADKAFIEGVKTATPKAAAAVEKTAAEDFAEEVFVDPVKAIAKFEARMKSDLRKEYDTAQAAQHQAQTTAATRANVWDNFFRSNPDLSAPETQDLVKGYLYDKNIKQLGSLPAEEGLKQLAAIARKTLRIQAEAAVPATVLPSAPVVTTGAGQSTTPAVTAPPQTENLDFVTQVRNLRKRNK